MKIKNSVDQDQLCYQRVLLSYQHSFIIYGHLVKNDRKGTSGHPRQCIWIPDCPLKLYRYPALHLPKGLHIVKGRQTGLEITKKNHAYPIGISNTELQPTLILATCIVYKLAERMLCMLEPVIGMTL